MDTLPPLLPPGCHVQGRRTLHIDLSCALARLGVEETPETRVDVAVMALEAAQHYGLGLAMGDQAQGASADRMEETALNLESATGALLELVRVPGTPDEAKRYAILASVWIAAAASLVPSEMAEQALRLATVAREVAKRAGLRLAGSEEAEGVGDQV